MDCPSTMARVSGNVMMKRAPLPGTFFTSMEPPSSFTLRRTTSRPTPRPDTSVVVSAVEKPGAKMSSTAWSSLTTSFWPMSPRERAFEMMRTGSIPPPSSLTSTQMLPPRWQASSFR
jgi:hypothetical protein